MRQTAHGVEGRASLWRDVRCGEAGFLSRLALSAVAGLALGAMAVLALGMAEALLEPLTRTYTAGGGAVRTYTFSPIRDEHVAIALSGAAVLWLVSLIGIWGTYRRYRNVLRTAFGVLAIGVSTILLCTLLANTMSWGADFFIATCVLAGIGSSILLITATVYRVRGGKSVFTADGGVNVHCPSCGYSMVGLEQSRCPECGSRYTLDELIRRQEYAVPKPPVAGPVRERAAEEHSPLLNPHGP